MIPINERACALIQQLEYTSIGEVNNADDDQCWREAVLFFVLATISSRH